MRENPVELLTVVNPAPSGETKWERWKYFLLFGAVSSVGYFMYSRQFAAATTGEEAQRASRNHFLFGIGSAAVLYLLFGDKLKEMMLQQERKRLARNEWNNDLGFFEEEFDLEENPAERYFVRLPREGVTYPKEGSKYYPEGYPLRKAQDFARIGSQTGGPREVRRGRRGGKRVRTYIKGKRTWPTTRAQVKNLLPAKIPKNLRMN